MDPISNVPAVKAMRSHPGSDEDSIAAEELVAAAPVGDPCFVDEAVVPLPEPCGTTNGVDSELEADETADVWETAEDEEGIVLTDEEGALLLGAAVELVAAAPLPIVEAVEHDEDFGIG